jgi:2-oxoglutarate dehydrogenase E2 component (dihydrolipoamide succinyltransferase)
MSTEIKTPMLPESVTDASIAVCHKKVGDWCDVGDVIVELETDKVMLEVTASTAGVLSSIAVKEGDIVHADSPIAMIDETATQGAKVVEPPVEEAPKEPQVQAPPVQNVASKEKVPQGSMPMSPSKRRDAYNSPNKSSQAPKSQPVAQMPSTGDFERKPMSRLRAKIAQRLVEATQETAMLTTFNEVRMDPIIRIRQDHQEAFVAKHGVKLGFMSFFTQAVCKALEDFPEINASVDGPDILYHQGKHIGVAVSTERGLVVPVLKNAQTMNYATIESQIKEMATLARAGKIGLEQLQGGTFTITNGGVFGSMLSTPILNMPQSAILGMHAIQKRPIVLNDEIVIASMMYLALSYDHRLVDGQQSVQFLVRIKNLLEDPDQVLLDL